MVAAQPAPPVQSAAVSTRSAEWKLLPSDLLAVAAVLPLLTSMVAAGPRLATSDVILATISPWEAALSIRGPVGIWAVCLSLTWLALAYRSRSFAVWEPLLVAVGALAALLRVGNAWLDGLALLLPLAVQLRRVHLGMRASILGALACLGMAVWLLLLARPPRLPDSAVTAAQSAAIDSRIFADWRWAPELQQRLGRTRTVLGARGLTSETHDFWTDYVRISLGHEHWAYDLAQRSIDLVVLNAADQSDAVALVRASSDWQVLDDADGALVAKRIGT